MVADEDILRSLSRLYRQLGGDPRELPIDSRGDLYRAFEEVGAPPDVLGLVASWHGMLTNHELLTLLEIRLRALR